jgi:glycosyltransferase involved in cell wall biosynthesis
MVERAGGQATSASALHRPGYARRPMSDNPRLVLHVIDSLGTVGGAEQQLVANLRRFADPLLRHALAVVYEDTAGSRSGEVPEGVPIHLLYQGGARPSGRWDLVRSFDRAVAEIQPHLIHGSLANAGLAARLVGARRRIPVVESLVNISHEPVRVTDNPGVTRLKLEGHRLLDRITMRTVTRFQALTAAVAESWERFVGLRPDRIEVIPRGIDLGELDAGGDRHQARASVISELGLADDAFVILAVGRVEPQKGHRYVVEAMPAISERIPSAVLLVAGRPGAASQTVETQIERLGLGDRVLLIGRRSDVPRLLGAADVFMFPSLFEGLGVSLLQAMGRALPVVTTDRRPMSDVVEGGVTGLLVPPEDPAAIAAAVTSLFSDPTERARLGAAARQEVAANYDADEVAARVERFYRRALDSGKG